MRVKRLDSKAVLPAYKTAGAAAFDIETCLPYPLWVSPKGYATIPTGLSFEIPEGYEVQIRPRSGHGSQGILTMFGTIDADYRGEIKIVIYNHTLRPFVVESGMRLAQGVLAPVTQAMIIETDEISVTDRGSDGFGSTGV